MDGFNLSSAADVYVGSTLARYVYCGSTLIWDAKKTPTYTAPTAVTGLTYNGSAQTLLNAGSTSHGTIYYSMDGSTWYTSVSSIQSTNANTSIPTYWKLVGDSRHYDVASTQITCSIAKADLNASVSMADWTYGGTASNPSVSGNVGGGSVTYQYKALGDATVMYTTTKPSNAGTYDIRAIIAETTNYQRTLVYNTFTIAKAYPTITEPTAANKTYNEDAQNIYNAGSNTTAGSFSYTNGSKTEPGTYTVSWTFTPTDTTNYDSRSGSFSSTIGKAYPSVVATAKTGLLYTGSAQDLFDIAAYSPKGNDITSQGTTSSAQKTNAGTYDVHSGGVSAGSWTPGTQTAYSRYYSAPAPWSSSVTVTIYKGTPTLSTAPAGLTKTYSSGSTFTLWSSASGTILNKIRIFSYYSSLSSGYGSGQNMLGGTALYLRAGTYNLSGNGNSGTWKLWNYAQSSSWEFSVSGQMGNISGVFTISTTGLYYIETSNSAGNIKIYPNSSYTVDVKYASAMPWKSGDRGKYGFGYCVIADGDVNAHGSYGSPWGSFVTTIT